MARAPSTDPAPAERPSGRAAARARSEGRTSGRRQAAPADSAPAGKGAKAGKDARPVAGRRERAAGAGGRARPAAAPSPGGRRRQIAVEYHIEGPRVRLGFLWFLLVLGTLGAALAGFGTVPLALLYALVAALGAAQSAKAWRRRRVPADLGVAALAGFALPLAAAVSTAALGAAILVVVVLALLRAAPLGPLLLLGAGRTLQCGLWIGGAAAGVVVTHRFAPWACLALVLVVSAYETGDYLVGSGARNALEGPVAGIAALLVVQFGVAAIGLPPFTFGSGLALGVAAAVLCPAGQLVGSLVLPDVRIHASGLRRLDSLILLAPVWAFQVGRLALLDV